MIQCSNSSIMPCNSNRFFRLKSFASTVFILSATYYSPSSASSRRSAPFTSRNDFGLGKESIPASSAIIKSRSRCRSKHSSNSNSNSNSNSSSSRNTDSIESSPSIDRASRSGSDAFDYDGYLEEHLHRSSNSISAKQRQRQRPAFGITQDYNIYSTQTKIHDHDHDLDSNSHAQEAPREHNSSPQLLQVPLSLVLQHDSSSVSEKRTPMKTFIDTGAQVTIMTLEAAKKAGIAHLIDSRYAGHACGVAGVSCRVLGRIPARTVSFVIRTNNTTNGNGNANGEEILDKSPAITVLEDKILGGGNHDGVDMLLGLDLLEEWKATLCLHERTLTVRDAKIIGRRRKTTQHHVIIPLTKNKRTSRAFVPSTSASASEPHLSKRKPEPSSRRDESCSNASTFYSLSDSSDDYMYQNTSGSTSSGDDATLQETRSHKEELLLTQDEEEEYFDDNYYFAQSDDDFDECDLSGV